MLRLYPAAYNPARVILQLTCEGDHGLFAPPAREFDEGGYTAARSAAAAAGWRRVAGRWHCPECKDH
jgi:hypothetical protein